MSKYRFINIVTNAVASIVARRDRNGKDFSIPDANKFAIKTCGVCMTITEAAANEVHRVMHMTNFAGRRTIVGMPTTIAKKPNMKEAMKKYREYFTLC
jgi:hypothetical protein